MTARVPAALLAALALAGASVTGCGRSEAPAPDGGADRSNLDAGEDVVLTPESVDPDVARRAAQVSRRSRARVVDLQGAGEEKIYASGADHVSPGAPSDDEVRTELREGRLKLARFRRFLGTSAYAITGPRARVLSDGTAVAPENAPESVKRVIQAGNAIANLPYKWGGGHGAWRDNGYDCSGSVSFALAGAGLLDAPRTSGGFMTFGAPGPGEWITIHAGSGHMYMVVAGLRFDTSGANGGTRWQAEPRGMSGLQVRHIPGL